MDIVARTQWHGRCENMHHPDSINHGKKYPAKAHARQVAKNLSKKKGWIFLPGFPTPIFEDSDMGGEFRQRRYFYYLCGIDEPDLNLIYDLETDDLTLFIRRRGDIRDIIYNGPSLTIDEAFEKFEVDKVGYNDLLGTYLKQFLLDGQKHLYVLHDADLKAFDLPDSELVNSKDLRVAVDAARVIKDDYEIRQIREANRISGIAHSEVQKYLTRLDNETGIEAIFIGTSLHYGAKHQAYNPIAAAGRNAATLHYMKNTDPLKGRQLVVLDAGAEWELYASDVTRTFPINGYWPTTEAESIHDLVLAMQSACIEKIRPGVLYRDLTVLAHYIAVYGLLELGILRGGSVEDILKAGTSAAFFPHGLGHHVGLDVHDAFDPENSLSSNAILPFGLTYGDAEATRFSTDVAVADADKHDACFRERYSHLVHQDARNSALSLSSTALRPGMVVTVEPGIYFNVIALEEIYLPSPVHSKYIDKQVLDRYIDVGGVRIEDDILVTPSYYENLTTAPLGGNAQRDRPSAFVQKILAGVNDLIREC